MAVKKYKSVQATSSDKESAPVAASGEAAATPAPADASTEVAAGATVAATTAPAASNADPFANPAPVAGAAADPFANTGAAPASPALDAPADVQTAAVEDPDADVSTVGKISGLFGSAFGGVLPGLVGPAVGLAGIVLASEISSTDNTQEPFFTSMPQAASVGADQLAVLGGATTGTPVLLSAMNLEVGLGGNNAPVLSSESLTIGDPSAAPPSGLPLNVDLSQASPVLNIDLGPVAQGSIQPNLLQASVSASNLINTLATNPLAIDASFLNPDLSGVSIGGQSLGGGAAPSLPGLSLDTLTSQSSAISSGANPLEPLTSLIPMP